MSFCWMGICKAFKFNLTLKKTLFNNFPVPSKGVGTDISYDLWNLMDSGASIITLLLLSKPNMKGKVKRHSEDATHKD